MPKNHVAVLGDLTAMFHARTVCQKNIDYRKVDRVLKNVMGVEEFGLVTFYTLFHQNNVNQTSFVDFLKRDLKWEVATILASEVKRTEDHKQYRFDARIAYELGNLVEDNDFNRVVVVSDSFDLVYPLTDVSEYLDEVKVAFFRETMDKRWDKVFNSDRNKLQFIDFEEEFNKQRIFQQDNNELGLDQYGK